METHEALHWSEGFKYVLYQRPDATAAWVDEIVGKVYLQLEHNGMKNMTGYDLCDFLRRWLKKERFENMSVCEVI